MTGEVLNYSDVSFLRCSSCAERTHCRQCGAEFSEALEARGDVIRAFVDPQTKTASVTMVPGAEENDILDALEEMGVFA